MKNMLFVAAVVGMFALTSCGSSGDDDGKSAVAVRDSTSKVQADSIAQAMKDSVTRLQDNSKK